MKSEDVLARERLRMVSDQLVPRGIRDEALLAAMREVPRHRFVPPSLAQQAYIDAPLPIGEGQTISQPFIVAEMTQLLALSGTEKVLEIGTGSGYQTAILSRLAREVVTIERVPALSERARRILEELDAWNVVFLVGDGSLGAPDEAPFDRAIVTAASPEVPGPLFEQLVEGGVMLIPIGGRWEQDICVVRKESGEMRKEWMGGCRFVPLLGRWGFAD